MKYISLFSGIGCFDLAFQQLAGWECLCYVEKNPFCIECLSRKISENYLQDAPIWDDATTFDGRPWVGYVDLVSGGDPCQANSAANQCSERSQSLADIFLRIVKEVVPKYVIRENPSKVRAEAPSSADYFANGLENLGYSTSLLEVRASDMGADHRRSRLFVCAEMVYPDNQRCEREVRTECKSIVEGRLREACRPNRWTAMPRISRRIDGDTHRMDRIRSLGNGVVPAVAAVISSFFDEAIVF